MAAPATAWTRGPPEGGRTLHLMRDALLPLTGRKLNSVHWIQAVRTIRGYAVCCGHLRRRGVQKAPAAVSQHSRRLLGIAGRSPSPR